MSNVKRMDKNDYYLNIARAVAQRSTCLRRRYGAVIIQNDEIISSGYNGSPRGADNCIDLGYCERESLQIAHGERYELCKSCHAEQNAIISASRDRMIGSTIYVYGEDVKTGKVVSGEPCKICAKMLQNAGIINICMSIPVEDEETYGNITD